MAEENGNTPGVNTADNNQDIKHDVNSAKQNANGKPGAGMKRGKGDDICRDFLNGICARGNRCRFRHPENEDTAANQSIVQYTFCIDFQNRGCLRDTCRFVHASSEDAERYQRKGIVSLPLARAIAATLTINDSINGIPICKEFQTGACTRGGNRCRYWHVNVDEERAARANMVRMGITAPAGPMGMHAYTPGMRRPAPIPIEYDYDHPPAKRGFPGRIPPPMSNEFAGTTAYITSLERRIESLEKELADERRRNSDLLDVLKNQHQPAAVPPPSLTQQYPGAWATHHESHHWN